MADDHIACPHCGKAYRWQSQIAGRKIRCVCGQKFRSPMTGAGDAVAVGPPPAAAEPPIELVNETASPPAAPRSASPPPPTAATSNPLPPDAIEVVDEPDAGAAPPAAPEPDPYDLDLPGDLADTAQEDQAFEAARRAATPANGKCPSCNLPLRPRAVICLNCGFNLIDGAKIQTQVDTAAEPEADATLSGGKLLKKKKKQAAKPTVESAPGPDASAASASGSGSLPADLDDRLRRSAARAAYDRQVADDTNRKFHRQENVIPLIVAGVGLLVLLFNAFVIAPRIEQTLLATFMNRFAPESSMTVETFIKSVVLLALQVPCLLAGLFTIAALFGSSFGSLTSALKKLIALALLCGQIDLALYDGFNLLLNGLGGIAWMLQAAVSFTVFWIVSKLMFDDLEVGETIGLWFAVGMIPSLLIFLYFIIS